MCTFLNININVIQTVTDGEFKHYNIGTTVTFGLFQWSQEPGMTENALYRNVFKIIRIDSFIYSFTCVKP